MSMSFSVYCGPYLKCELDENQVLRHYDILDDVFYDPRCESRPPNPKQDYLVPDAPPSGIDREFSFNSYHQGPSLENIDSRYETEAFKELYTAEIDKLKTIYKSVEVGWGIMFGFG